ncbi:hypothetical protein CLOM_g21694 [Closterium sp. NIES-68]|nr:hypothetical protein CLOM_g21694 [Closterium sp. NIES-68]
MQEPHLRPCPASASVVLASDRRAGVVRWLEKSPSTDGSVVVLNGKRTPTGMGHRLVDPRPRQTPLRTSDETTALGSSGLLATRGDRANLLSQEVRLPSPLTQRAY